MRSSTWAALIGGLASASALKIDSIARLEDSKSVERGHCGSLDPCQYAAPGSYVPDPKTFFLPHAHNKKDNHWALCKNNAYCDEYDSFSKVKFDFKGDALVFDFNIPGAYYEEVDIKIQRQSPPREYSPSFNLYSGHCQPNQHGGSSCKLPYHSLDCNGWQDMCPAGDEGGWIFYVQIKLVIRIHGEKITLVNQAIDKHNGACWFSLSYCCTKCPDCHGPPRELPPSHCASCKKPDYHHPLPKPYGHKHHPHGPPHGPPHGSPHGPPHGPPHHPRSEAVKDPKPVVDAPKKPEAKLPEVKVPAAAPAPAPESQGIPVTGAIIGAAAAGKAVKKPAGPATGVKAPAPKGPIERSAPIKGNKGNKLVVPQTNKQAGTHKHHGHEVDVACQSAQVVIFGQGSHSHHLKELGSYPGHEECRHREGHYHTYVKHDLEVTVAGALELNNKAFGSFVVEFDKENANTEIVIKIDVWNTYFYVVEAAVFIDCKDSIEQGWGGRHGSHICRPETFPYWYVDEKGIGNYDFHIADEFKCRGDYVFALWVKVCIADDRKNCHYKHVPLNAA